jgi:hypothetical protein
MKAFKLESEPKTESGFKTPENYFENFSEKVMQQLPEKETGVISLYHKNKRIFMAVAAILILALFVPLFNTTPTISNSDAIDAVALENYLSYQSNINQYDLINDLEYDEIDNIKTTVVLEDATIEEILVSNANLEHLIFE